MPAVVKEQPKRDSSSGENPTQTRYYWIYDSDDLNEVEAALFTTAPSFVSTPQGLTLYLDDASVSIVDDSDSIWEATITYGQFTPTLNPAPGGGAGSNETGFEISTSTVKVKQSFNTANSYAPGGATAEDFGGAIGVSKDGDTITVEGTDKLVPVYVETLRVAVAPQHITNAFKTAIYNAVGKVNSDTIFGIAPGQVLFLGCSGVQRDASAVELSYKLAVSPNATGLSVGDITGIAKNGWQYLWALYDNKKDANAKSIVKKPIAAYVEDIYESTAMASLIPGA